MKLLINLAILFLCCIGVSGQTYRKEICVGLAQWKFSGDKHKSLQVDTERTFHQRYPLVML